MHPSAMTDTGLEEDIIAILRTMAEDIAQEYTAESTARRLAKALARRFQWHFGGQMVYIPKGKDRVIDLTERNLSIWEEYLQSKRKGLSNINHLARKYGLSTNQIYSIINSFRAPN